METAPPHPSGTQLEWNERRPATKKQAASGQNRMLLNCENSGWPLRDGVRGSPFVPLLLCCSIRHFPVLIRMYPCPSVVDFPLVGPCSQQVWKFSDWDFNGIWDLRFEVWDLPLTAVSSNMSHPPD